MNLQPAVACLLILVAASCFAQPPARPEPAKPFPKYANRTLKGRVVWLNEALERKYGIKTVPEAAERGLALEATDGVLHPLVEDARGRAFRADERLRTMPVVILTSSREDRDLVDSWNLGVNAYVVKPVDDSQFLDAVKTLGYFWAVVNAGPEQ